jgi:signal transduction histidine kinase
MGPTAGDQRQLASDSIAWVSDQPPSRWHTWLAIGVAACAFLGFLVILPFADARLAHLNALFPTLDAIVFVTDLVTAVLLFAQLSISRSKSLLALAGGYLFTALIVVPHALTFAGAFSPTGLLGAGIQTGSWLFIFWHIGFSAALLAYALLRLGRTSETIATTSPARMITAVVVSLMALVIGLTWLATSGAYLLPAIILDETRISPIVRYPIWFTVLLSASALLALAFHTRRTVLDQWLMVVAFVSIGELAFSGLIPTVRFSAGFYAGRAFSLLTSSILLIVLLEETMRLYARLFRANEMLRREQDNKMMNLEAMAASIAHEVRQPLTVIGVNGATALEFLDRNPPDVKEAADVVSEMMASSEAANQVFTNMRTLFSREELQKAPVDVNDLVLETLVALRFDLARHRIATQVELASPLASILGNKSQLREVITNLVLNAIEAMESADGDRTLKLRTSPHGNGAIELAIEDSGRGFEEQAVDRSFEAFVTTKTKGMGLGLAICRLIAERHGGSIFASNLTQRGARVQVILPAG